MNKETNLENLSIRIQEIQNKRNETDKELKDIKKTYNETLLGKLGATEEDPLSSFAQEIMDFAKWQKVDPKWFFQTVNAITLFRMSWPLFDQIPDNYTIQLPDDEFHLGKNKYLKDALLYMRLGSYDDSSQVPLAEKIIQEGYAVTETYERSFNIANHPKRISPVFKWINENARLLAWFNGFGNRKDYKEILERYQRQSQTH